MKILIACEFSGIVREAFRKKGHDVWSCDLLPSEDDTEYHIQGDVIEHLKEWTLFYDMIIAHPPCTYIANSGVRWLYNKDGSKNWDRWRKMDDASNFFAKVQLHQVMRQRIKLCIENPIIHKHAGLSKYTQLIQPYQFGHTTSKATCLWLYGLPKLEPTNIIPKEERTFDIHKMAPGPNRQKDRSRTFQGIADAMAEQWS